jgi:UDP-N-acetylmuramoyl-L-alanyl-D-glutamate--2,6-diaminopimelate ligase
LSEIIEGVELSSRLGDQDPRIGKITFDSRQVEQGDLFVAIRGTEADGHQYIYQALQSGAAAVVCQEPAKEPLSEAPVLQVPDSRKALGQMASAFYGHPSRELSLVGVTGTNGKTTIASLLHQMHVLMGFRAGLLSTIQVLVGEESHPATHTTPDPVQINELLRMMVEQRCEYCFMEVSSHAIDQERIAGLEFNGGIFTNLTRDHLDYHKDFGEYLTVKKRFFDGLPEEAFALVNRDDKHGKVMLQNCRAEHHFYSLHFLGDFRGKIKEMHLEGTSMEINGREVWVKLPGRFNAGNLLCAFGASVLLGHHTEEVLAALSELNPVTGRFETYRSEKGATAIVDYAHTPDALTNVLETIAEVNVTHGQVITVVGAGGDRDPGKRPQMAKIAAEASHKLILTSDNPRSEDPETILDQMMEGVPQALRKQVLRISNREEAIRTACMLAAPKDIVLVAGKGHEKQQIIGKERFPFDDMQILKQHLNG